MKDSDEIINGLVEEINAMLRANPPVPPEEFKDRVERLTANAKLKLTMEKRNSQQGDLFYKEEQLAIPLT